jgi:YbbR domain-containing protein
MVFFLVALLIWSAIESEQRAVAQRALEVPLSITGLGPERVARGVPANVIVIVSGLSDTVERLRPEYFDAFIDLREVSAEFDVVVRVIAPQDVEVEEVTPGRIIGITEALGSRTVPLRLSVLGVGRGSDGWRLSSQPDEVVVSGQESQVARVSYVTALLGELGEDGSAVVNGLFAVDGDDLPVPDLRIMPDEVVVLSEHETLLYSRRLPVDFEPLAPAPLSVGEVTLSQDSLLVAGPREAVLPLESVAVQADMPAVAGVYQVTLSPVLPEGVVALESLSAEVSLMDPEANEAAQNSPAGVTPAGDPPAGDTPPE